MDHQINGTATFDRSQRYGSVVLTRALLSQEGGGGATKLNDSPTQTRGNALHSNAQVHLYSLCQTRLTLKTHTMSETENRTSYLTTVSQTISQEQPPLPPRVGKPGSQQVGEQVGGAFYPTWRAGSNLWRFGTK